MLHSPEYPGEARTATARYSLLLLPAAAPALVGAAALEQLRRLPLVQATHTPQQRLPFNGGWFVYAGYELAETLEPHLQLPMPKTTCRAWPTLFLQRCDQAVIVDHVQQCSWLVSEQGGAALAQLQAQVELAAQHSSVVADAATAELVEEVPARFLQGVAAIKAYIHAGDVFQVNLSRLWHGATRMSDVQLYHRLLRSNPSPFSCMARLPFGSIISSSPERLCSVRDGRINTRPIAGTRPQGGQPERERDALCRHPKERAEHVMLVDLERNDLGRIARPGSVSVDAFMQVESYRHVHHLVSSIHADLRPDCSAHDLLRALFPGGTITGCPKIRCMEIIAELEQEGRGAYTGSLGYIDNNGDLDLNILIRTLLLQDGRLAFRTGAGIVADSDAEAELGETRAKAEGLLRALGGQGAS